MSIGRLQNLKVSHIARRNHVPILPGARQYGKSLTHPQSNPLAARLTVEFPSAISRLVRCPPADKMSARDGKDYKQDMLVSIRYRNDLPPPPMPPKLLDIDTGGLQQYLDPGFAASIAKREEPNIEADAEGGMPIDVIGMYGYFDADESSIMAPDFALPLGPEDEALMLTPDQLKSGGATTNPNFLRKTQYMTAASGVVNDPLRSTQARLRKMSTAKPTVMARDDKENIKQNIQKAFDLAYPGSGGKGPLPIPAADRTAWDNPVHPDASKRHLKPVAFYPISPDWEAATNAGSSFNLLRFDKPPLPALKGRRDDRIDTSLLMSSTDPTKSGAYEAALKAYEADPKNYEHPGFPPTNWSLLLPKDPNSTTSIRTVFDSNTPKHEMEDLLAEVGEPNQMGQIRLPYTRSKFYSNTRTESIEEGQQTRKVIVSISNKDNAPSVAHFYPLAGITLLKSDRGKLGQSQRHPVAQDVDLEADLADLIMVLPRDPEPVDLYNRYVHREAFDPAFKERFKEIERMAEAQRAAEEAAQAEAQAEADGEKEAHVNGHDEDDEANGDVSMAEPDDAPQSSDQRAPPQARLVPTATDIDEEDDD